MKFFLIKVSTKKGLFHVKHNVTVTIHNDYVIKNKEEIQKILDRVSKIISNSHVRQMKGGVQV